MAVAIEHSLEVPSGVIYYDIGIQYGIHALRAAVGQCCAVLFPVVAVVDDVAELLGGIAVGSRVACAAYPCVAAIGVGGNTGRHEETVLDRDRTIAPAHEATDRITLVSIKTSIELTVTEGDIAIAEHSSDEATHRGIAIHTALERDRRLAVLYLDGVTFVNTANQATMIHF